MKFIFLGQHGEGEGGTHTEENRHVRCERWKERGTTLLCLYILLSLPLVSLLSVSVMVSEQVNKRTSTLQSCAFAIGVCWVALTLGVSFSRRRLKWPVVPRGLILRRPARSCLKTTIVFLGGAVEIFERASISAQRTGGPIRDTVRTREIHYLRTVTNIPVNCDISPR